MRHPPRATLARTTRYLRWLWAGFPRLRRFLARSVGWSRGQWDGQAWHAIGPRVFGDRTVLAMDSEGHIVRVRPSHFVDLTALFGRPEEAKVTEVVRALHPGAVFIDAGAHVGRYSLMAADRVGPAGRVIAVEPSPATFDLLCENVSLNGKAWILPVKVALGVADGTADLIAGSDEATNTLRGDWLDHLEGARPADQRFRQMVTVRSLSSLLAELGVRQVDLLKIDVEGAEWEVLQGALPLLQDGKIRQIVCEVHQPAVRWADVEVLLKNCGYVVSDLGHSELYAIRRSTVARTIQQPLRLAIVGCGAITEMAHIPAASQLEEVRLVGLVDTDLAHAQALASRYGIPVAEATLDDMVDEIDAVILATPPHVRSVLAQQALRHGLHVLCEKPMANSAAECRQMIAAARDAQRTLAVAHTYRFFPNRINVYSLLQQEALGTVSSVGVEQGDPANWPTHTGYTFRHEMVAGGVLLNEGIHSLDTLFWWFGYPLDFEYGDDALGGLESNVRIKMSFTGGISGTFRLSRTCKLENRIAVNGEQGSISVSVYDQAQVLLSHDGEKVTQTVAPCKGGFVGVVAKQLHDFVESIETKRLPRVTGADGLRVIEFIETCYALKRRRPLPKRAPIPGLTW